MFDDATERLLKVAVVGLGYWGPNLLRVLCDDTTLEVKWICDLSEERLARYHRRYPGTRVTTSFHEVLADEDTDAVVLATPVFTHYDMAAASLAAGKHTFVEKPLAPSGPLADDLIEQARARDLVLMCGHTFIYSPPVQTLRRMLDERRFGDLFFITSSRVNLGMHQRDVSVVWDLAPHDLSILLYWLGEVPQSIRTVGRDYIVKGIPDVAFVTMEFPSGVIANIELSWLSPSKLRRTVVVGSERMAIYDDGTAEPIRVFDHGVVYRDPETFGQYHLSYRTGDIVAPHLDTYEPLVAELAAFAKAIRTGDRLPFHTALARNVVRMTEAADRSLYARGEEIRLEPGDDLPRMAPPELLVTGVAG